MAREKKGKPAAPEITRKQLESLVDEMNEVMLLDPKITFDGKTSDDDLKEMILNQATDQIYTTDFEEDPEDPSKPIFSEEATETIKLLGITIVEQEPAAETPAEAPPEPEGKEKGKGKGKGKETPPAKEKDKGKPEAPATSEKKGKPDPKYSRANSFADACKELKADQKAVSIDDLAAKANAIYKKNGGNDNVKQSKHAINVYYPVLVAFGNAVFKDGALLIK